MPNFGSSPEASAIEEAYAERIRELFKVLFTNLIDTSGSDRQSATKFSVGLNLAKRARDLALGTIESPSSAETRASRSSTRSRKKKASR